MCPIFWADTDDLSLRTEDQAFLIGSDLLVVPKWADSVQLPKGIWRSVSLVGEDAKQDKYQCDLKVRGGSIVPTGPIIQTTEEITEKSPLKLIVVLDEQGRAEGTLYEDAGDGYDYLKGQFCFSVFQARKQDNTVLVTCTSQKGKLKSDKRLVSITVVNSRGTFYGFGDICSGVKVMLH